MKNKFELIQEMIAVAKELQAKDREARAMEEEKEQTIRTINTEKPHRNFALEAFHTVMEREQKTIQPSEDDASC